MTVKELIERLQQCDDKTARVNVYDSEAGNIDITETFVTMRTSPLTGETRPVLVIY